MSLQVGDRLCVRAYKADGRCYRRWWSTVEAVAADRVVAVTPVGCPVKEEGGSWASKYATRWYYWTDRKYNLVEVYAAGGRLHEIYVHISSPVEIGDGELRFTDHELDVVRKPPQGARVVDEDEFREAAAAYGYSEDFQRACHRVARELVGVADGWLARGMPDVQGMTREGLRAMGRCQAGDRSEP